MATIFQTSKRLATFPAGVPIYKITESPTKKDADDYWHYRLKEIGASLGLDNGKTIDERDYIFSKEGPRTLQIFKASNAFLFYNSELVSPAVEDKNMLNPKTARDRSIETIRKQNLVDDGAEGRLFKIYYAGDGYTVAQTAKAGAPDGEKWEVKEESDLYKTEIRSHFRYLLGGLPVFGPGAKTILSYVGEELSEQIHFWRKPAEIFKPNWEIITPQTAISRLCKDKYFVKVAKVNKRHQGMSSGRFYDDIALGYYATPPVNKQRFYIPVYKIRGTFESRENIKEEKFNGFKGTEPQKTFRYDFVHYVSAMHGDGPDCQLKDFRRQVIF